MSGILGIPSSVSNLMAQKFTTIPVPQPGLALYTLSLRQPVPAMFSFFTYTFPLSPQALRKEFTAMSAVYDVAGSPIQNGVQRVVDQYGLSPFTFVIEGTTGQKRHSTDGYLFTGRQSIDQIIEILDLYTALNQKQIMANNPKLWKLEFYDYYTQQFWEVVPVGPQGITMSNAQPTLLFYRFRFAGVKPVSAPIISDLFADQVQQMFIAASSVVAGAVSSLIGSVLGAY
jgi:hypothetical protein